MILRKPYALLIKHFKKIHLVLCILMAYLAFESRNILIFLNNYISTGTFTRTSFSLPSIYINIYMFLITIIVAGIALVVYILMRQKKKPKLLYFITIGFYLGMVVFFFQIYNTLGILEVSTISPRSLRIIRDVTSVICYVQYAFILIMAVRAVGFDIKKFNFGEDLAELEIDVSDDEEFELTVGVDPNEIGRRFRRGKRELKYFIVENFFVLSLIFAVVAMSTGIVIFMNVEVYNKIYTQTEPFKAGYFVNTVDSCYYTHLNQRGVNIAKKGKLYAIAKVTFNNKSSYDLQLNLDDINLTDGKNIFSPIITTYQAFQDLGIGYTNQTIGIGKSSTFIFVFEVDENADFNNMIFRYRESLKITTTRMEATYKKVKLVGVNIDSVTQVGETKKGDLLTLAESALQNTKFAISDVQIQDEFTYDATSCYNNSCSTSKTRLTIQYTTTQKTLMKLSSTYTKDPKIEISNANTLADLIKSYGFLRYSGNGKVYTSSLVNETPGNYNGSDLFYQVPSGVKYATKIQLVLRIRDKEYAYNLK